MVLNGLINTQLVALCRSFGISAIGIGGVDGGLVQAHRRAPVTLASGEVVDYGMVGDIDGIDGSVVTRLLDSGFLPVVSPLSCDNSGQLLNINADTVAAAIGGALVAEKLILCTGAPGILERVDDPQSLISYTDLAGLRRLREEGRDHRRHVAEVERHRGGDSRRRAPRARDLVRRDRLAARRDLHQRRQGHAGRRGHQGADGSRARPVGSDS